MNVVSKIKKGFTLLELVVVIVVIGILASIAIPTYGQVIERANEKSAQTTAQSFVAEAKIIAAFDNMGSSTLTAPAMETAQLDAPTVVDGTVPGTYTVTVGAAVATIDAAGVITVVTP